MQFKGQLLLPGETGSGLRVNLDVAAHHLAVESDGGGLGAWPLEVVDVERNGEEFQLTVAGEPLRFVADDTIGFAYSGVPVIEGVTTRSRGRAGFRSVLNRIWNGPEDSESTVAVEEPPEVESERPEPPSAPLEKRDFLSTRLLAAAPEAIAEEPPPTPASPVDQQASEPDGATTNEVCPGVTSDGRPCESQILTSSGYCYPHDPKRAFEDGYQLAQEARAQLKRDSTGRLNRIYERLDKAIRQVERGDLDPQTAMAIAQLARTMCAIVEIDEPQKS